MNGYVQLELSTEGRSSLHRCLACRFCFGAISFVLIVVLRGVYPDSLPTMLRHREDLDETMLGKMIGNPAISYPSNILLPCTRFCPRLHMSGELHQFRAAAALDDSESALMAPPVFPRRSAIIGATSAAIGQFLQGARADTASDEIVDQIVQDEIESAMNEKRDPNLFGRSSPRARSLADHLQKIGATMYGTYWCKYVWQQKNTLGKEGLSMVRYVECSPYAERNNAKLCDSKRVESYPTWEINGKIYTGDKSLEQLEELSNAPRWKA